MAVRSLETNIRNAPGAIPKMSASHSDRSRRGEWSARIASKRRWLALGRSIAEPSTATACTPPSKRTLLIAGSEPATSALSHADSFGRAPVHGCVSANKQSRTHRMCTPDEAVVVFRATRATYATVPKRFRPDR